MPLNMLLFAIAVFVVLPASVFWLWMIVDCVLREFTDPNTKPLWILGMLVGWLVGAIIYCVAGRPQGRLPAGPRAG